MKNYLRLKSVPGWDLPKNDDQTWASIARKKTPQIMKFQKNLVSRVTRPISFQIKRRKINRKDRNTILNEFSDRDNKTGGEICVIRQQFQLDGAKSCAKLLLDKNSTEALLASDPYIQSIISNAALSTQDQKASVINRFIIAPPHLLNFQMPDGSFNVWSSSTWTDFVREFVNNSKQVDGLISTQGHKDACAKLAATFKTIIDGNSSWNATESMYNYIFRGRTVSGKIDQLIAKQLQVILATLQFCVTTTDSSFVSLDDWPSAPLKVPAPVSDVASGSSASPNEFEDLAVCLESRSQDHYKAKSSLLNLLN